MDLAEGDLEFLRNTHAAAMVTVADGVPKVARVGVALVDGKLWSSGTQDRVRTARLRQDPRCTVYVHGHGFAWIALETTVTILEGPDVPHQSVRLFREMQGKPTGPLAWYGKELDEDAFAQAMIDEQRLLYEFEVHHTYGLH